MRLIDDEESRRLLWYAALLKPIYDDFKVRHDDDGDAGDNDDGSTPKSRLSNRSIVVKLLVDDLKRLVREAEAIKSILKAADDFAQLLRSGGDVYATMILLSDIRVRQVDRDLGGGGGDCCVAVEDPLWAHAMEFRWQCSKVLKKIGWLWRASMILAVTV